MSAVSHLLSNTEDAAGMANHKNCFGLHSMSTKSQHGTLCCSMSSSSSAAAAAVPPLVPRARANRLDDSSSSTPPRRLLRLNSNNDNHNHNHKPQQQQQQQQQSGWKQRTAQTRVFGQTLAKKFQVVHLMRIRQSAMTFKLNMNVFQNDHF